MVVDWSGQVALVSGAGSERGIGFAIAQRLGSLGVRLIITGSSARIHERVKELRATGLEVQGRAADLSQEDQVLELTTWAESVWGRVDILVNNAGMAAQGHPEPFAELAEMSVDSWNLSIARNLTTAFLLTRGILPGMRNRRYGRIVNVSSTTGTRAGNTGEAAYAAAKAAMVGMNMSLALEVAGYGITVNSVAPGWIATGSSTPEEEHAAKYVPVGRAGRPDSCERLLSRRTSVSEMYARVQGVYAADPPVYSYDKLSKKGQPECHRQVGRKPKRRTRVGEVPSMVGWTPPTMLSKSRGWTRCG